MKTISPPITNPPPPPNWWVGYQVACSKCKAVFELELGDKVETSTERRPGGKTTGKIFCPTEDCLMWIHFDKKVTR